MLTVILSVLDYKIFKLETFAFIAIVYSVLFALKKALVFTKSH
jgi:hypothetical protein